MPAQNSIRPSAYAGAGILAETKAMLSLAKPGKVVPFRKVAAPLKMSEDSLLLQKIAVGNGWAFTVMYNRKLMTIQKYITVLSGSEKQYADDIVQDIFLKLWEKRKALAAIESFDGYLFCMVRNRLITEKGKARIRQKGLGHMSRIFHDSAESTEQDVHYHQLYRIYEESIRALPPRAKIAYELKENAGMKNEAIAKAMGISESVAKQHVMAANKKIRSLISGKYTMI